MVDLSREFSNFSSQAKPWPRQAAVSWGLPARPSPVRTPDSGLAGAAGPLDWDGSNFLDAAQVDELVTMYIGGKTMREVAEHFGVQRTTVAIHLRRRSVAVRRGKLTGVMIRF